MKYVVGLSHFLVCEVRLTWEWDHALAKYKDHPRSDENCPNPRTSIVPDQHFVNCTLEIANVAPLDAIGEWECTVGHWSMGRASKTFELEVFTEEAAPLTVGDEDDEDTPLYGRAAMFDVAQDHLTGMFNLHNNKMDEPSSVVELENTTVRDHKSTTNIASEEPPATMEPFEGNDYESFTLSPTADISIKIKRLAEQQDTPPKGVHYQHVEAPLSMSVAEEEGRVREEKESGGGGGSADPVVVSIGQALFLSTYRTFKGPSDGAKIEGFLSFLR